MARLQKAAEFLGLRRSIAGLLVMVILVGMGERMAERFLPLYLMVGLGAGARWPGYLNALDQLLSALYSFPGGALSDRLGVRRALLVFNLLAVAGYLVVILVPAKEAVLAGSVLFLSWTAISLPASMSLIARVLPEDKRVMGVTLHSLVRRVPMALGPILGGALILKFGERDGVRLAFAAALVMALIAAGIQQIFIPPDEPGRRRTSRTSPIEVLGRMRRPLRNLLAADILIRFCEQIPYAYLAIWCIRETGAVNALEFGTLTAVEMATAMVVYIPVAYYADRAGKKPFILITFAIFTAFPLALFWARSFWPLVAAFVIRGLKEFGEPTRKALIMDLSPEDGQASMFGAYYLLRDVFVSLAALGGAFLWQASPALNLFTAFGFGLAGTLWFARFGANDPRSSRPATAVG